MNPLTKSGFMQMNEKCGFFASIFSRFLAFISPVFGMYAYRQTSTPSVLNGIVKCKKVLICNFFYFLQKKFFFLNFKNTRIFRIFRTSKLFFISFFIKIFGFIFSNSFFLFLFFSISFLFSFLQRRIILYLSGVLKVSAGSLPTVFFTPKNTCIGGVFCFYINVHMIVNSFFVKNLVRIVSCVIRSVTAATATKDISENVDL